MCTRCDARTSSQINTQMPQIELLRGFPGSTSTGTLYSHYGNHMPMVVRQKGKQENQSSSHAQNARMLGVKVGASTSDIVGQC